MAKEANKDEREAVCATSSENDDSCIASIEEKQVSAGDPGPESRVVQSDSDAKPNSQNEPERDAPVVLGDDGVEKAESETVKEPVNEAVPAEAVDGNATSNESKPQEQRKESGERFLAQKDVACGEGATKQVAAGALSKEKDKSKARKRKSVQFSLPNLSDTLMGLVGRKASTSGVKFKSDTEAAEAESDAGGKIKNRKPTGRRIKRKKKTQSAMGEGKVEDGGDVVTVDDDRPRSVVRRKPTGRSVSPREGRLSPGQVSQRSAENSGNMADAGES